MANAMRQVLNAALDIIEQVESIDPAEAAQNLKPSDFGGGVDVRIGLNYMKGEIEVLTEERDHARERAELNRTCLREAQAARRQDQYAHERAIREMRHDYDIQILSLKDTLRQNGISWPIEEED